MVARRRLDHAQRQVVAALGGTGTILVIQGAAGAGEDHHLGVASNSLAVGIIFTQKAAAKAIPFGIGVAFSATTNYALSRFVGRKAISFFEVRDQMRAEGEVI